MSRRTTYYGASSASASYLLDQFPATHAFALRRLATGSTAAVRVRRSSDNAEQDFGFDGADFDEAGMLSFTGTGAGDYGFIVDLANQGTGSAPLQQTNPARQPSIVTGGVPYTEGGRTAWRSTGNGNFEVFLVNLPQPWTIATVCKPTASNRVIHRDAVQSNFNVRIVRPQDGSYILVIAGGVLKGTSNRENVHTVFTAVANGAASCLHVNGVEEDVGTLANGLDTISFFSGLIGTAQEVIIWGSDQSANLATIDTEIMSYYGL